jgi:hypothetical protein
MNINDDIDDSDYYIPSHKEDVESGIFRRKVGHLNNDERIKKNLIKESNNYVIFLYIVIVVILFMFVLQNIFYEDNYNNLQKLHYLKYKLSNNSKYNIST